MIAYKLTCISFTARLVSLDWTNISAGVNGAVEYLANVESSFSFTSAINLGVWNRNLNTLV
jgi:hypothetical protein